MRFNIPLTKNLWATGHEVGRRAAGREVDRGPWAAGRGPPGRGPAFSKTLNFAQSVVNKTSNFQ